MTKNQRRSNRWKLKIDFCWNKWKKWFWYVAPHFWLKQAPTPAPLPAKQESTIPSSEMTEEQWRGAMAKEAQAQQKAQKPEKEWQEPFAAMGDKDGEMTPQQQAALDRRARFAVQETFDLPELNDEAYRRQRLLSMLEETTSMNSAASPSAAVKERDINITFAFCDKKMIVWPDF